MFDGHELNNSDQEKHYSTDEQVIGTWIDDRPLYSKTFSYRTSWGGGNGTLSSEINLGIISDIILVNSYGAISIWSDTSVNAMHYTIPSHYNNGNRFSVCYSSSNSTLTAQLNIVSSVTIGLQLYVTIEYVKR